MSIIDKLNAFFGAGLWKPHSARLFRILLYTWFLFNLAFLLPVADLLWGKEALLKPIYEEPSLVKNLFYFLNYMRDMYWVILILHGMSAILALLGVLGWVPRLGVYITGGMMYYSAYLAFNSGFLLMWILSFYAIFLPVKPRDSISRIIGNFALLACIIQFVMVYFFAAWWKWTGSTWLNGSSLYYVLHMDHFSRPVLQHYLLPFPGVLAFLTWFGLVYQSVFPFLIWWKRSKYILLAAGIAFHLFIIFGMRLYDFGTAMIFGYSLFIDEAMALRILKFLRLAKDQSRESMMASTE